MATGDGPLLSLLGLAVRPRCAPSPSTHDRVTLLHGRSARGVRSTPGGALEERPHGGQDGCSTCRECTTTRARRRSAVLREGLHGTRRNGAQTSIPTGACSTETAARALRRLPTGRPQASVRSAETWRRSRPAEPAPAEPDPLAGIDPLLKDWAANDAAVKRAIAATPLTTTYRRSASAGDSPASWPRSP